MNQELYDKLMQELGASLAAMYQSKSEIDRLQGNWEAAEKEVQALKLENARLREALNSLANEAAGFLHCADAMQHGVTNMQVFQLRIDEARAALEGKQE